MELESYYNFTYIWKKRVFRFVLGMQQLIYLPLINLLWLLVGFLFFNLYKTLIRFLTIFSKLLICRYSLSLQALPVFYLSGDTHIFS